MISAGSVGKPKRLPRCGNESAHFLRSLPSFAYDCCATTSARLNGYSMIVYETNRYSVPVNRARKDVVVKAYPFHIEILDGTTLLARHRRSYQREQDFLEPVHYLALLENDQVLLTMPRPMRQWKQGLAGKLPSHVSGPASRSGQKEDEVSKNLSVSSLYMKSIQPISCSKPLNRLSPMAVLTWMGCCIAYTLTCSDDPATSQALAEHSHLQAIGTQPSTCDGHEQLLRSSG